ncbi:PEP-CTERM sorting domain-containing protein [Rariglobus hedericola]|uniref:PEP-CTERM sorting domain-containing protein n=1 Tax=Rariglobus hedericola TaxID=2597822 RepID=A0A556QL37_9BACT|nr:PEP-CTERM sorting domain-containing protein [Rariglobus hedericola]TSJ77312.1 PEP-CTERM sorting domain-containing protein [Rariglobus hedericola]
MKNPTHLAGAWKQFAGLSAAVLLAHTVSAVTLTFNTAADYDNNFYEVANGGDLTASVANGYLYKSNGTATSAIYNTHSTGALTAGAGGTTGGTPIDTFGDFTIEATFSSSQLAAASTGIGFFTKINGGVGYAALFRLTSATTADFRLYEPASPLSLGTQIGSDQTITRTSGSFATNSFYIARLTVTDVGTNVRFEASIWTTTGTQLGNTITLTDTTSAIIGLGEVGIRAGSSASHNLQIDSFSISAIPEPSSYALLASGGALFVALLRRNRTQR